MIISRTPYRISFFGGGSDYPSWYRANGGAVLATTINKYCYLTCRYLPPFFEHRYRIVYSKSEEVWSIDEIAHPAVKAVLRYLGIDRGVELHHDGDLPARSGLGSSSSFTVGLLHALHGLRGKMLTKHELAMQSIEVEQQVLRETVGSQDQVLAAYGGMNHVAFLTNGDVNVRPVTLAPERLRDLNDHLMLFYTGIKRTASSVASTYVEGLQTKDSNVRLMVGMVDEALAILNGGGDLAPFGKLLDEGWRLKRSLGDRVSNAHIDDLYQAALDAGALGGKLIGAGGGGFLLVFAPPSRHDGIRAALRRLLCVPFRFEFGGSQIIFYEPEEDYLVEEQLRESQRVAAFQELADLASRG